MHTAECMALAYRDSAWAVIRAMGKELPFPFHPCGIVRNDTGCAERGRKEIKNERSSFGQTFISHLVLPNRAGGAVGTAASTASCKINAYGGTLAKRHVSTSHIKLENVTNG